MGGAQWQFGPTRLHSLTAAGRGSGGRESISPGEGDGVGSNSLPRTIRIAVWEIFSEALAVWEIFSQILVESLCDLGNFFRVFALQENNFGPKNSDSSRESAAAPPVRDSPKFFSTQSCFEENFSQNIHEHQRKNAKSAKKFTRTHTIKSLFLSLCESLCEA